MREKIVITGLGIVSPIGIGKDDFYRSLKEGKSGINPISGFKTETDQNMAGGGDP
jgi:3-oxoacyl-[acyl-carrier-protein] synthase II